MQRILQKRLLRDLRANFVRYTALFLLITVGMYIIVSLISVSEAVDSETKKNYVESNVEDGNFSMMVPLSDTDFTSLENRGVTIEPCFYMDYQYEEDNSTVRIFHNRDNIDRIQLDDGKLAKNENEIVLEKVYADVHNLKTDDEYQLAGRTFTITGIGSVVDYDEPLRENDSIGSDSSTFGLGFVSSDMYDVMRTEGLAMKSEIYLYAYQLNDVMTDQELKRELSKIKPDLAGVKDVYIQELIGTLKSTRADLERGLKDLNSGISELAKGRNELQTGTSDIQKASNEFATGTSELASGSSELKSATSELASGSGELLEGSGDLSSGAAELANGAAEVASGGEELGSGVIEFADGANEVDANATELASGIADLQGYYEEVAERNEEVKAMADTLLEAEKITKEQHDNLYAYVDGVDSLGEGITVAASGSQELQSQGTSELAAKISELSSGIKELQVALLELKSGSAELSAGTAELYANLAELKSGSAELDSGAGEVVNGANEINGYAKEFNSSISELQNGTKELSNGVTEFQKGTSTLQSKADELIRDYLNYDISNLRTFMPRSENARIGAANLSLSVYKSAGIILGVILSTLFAYVISVFVSHNIEKEGMIIGALYSMGVNKKELMMHYLTLPAILTFLGGICGTMIGFSPIGTRMQIASVETYYSLPYCPTVFPAYLIVYGVLLPPIITIIVNYFIINSKLSSSALSLLRNEKKQSKLGRMNLGKLGFINCFRIRQFFKELRSSIAIMVGIFISLILVILGLNTNALCQNLVNAAKNETSYNYMYVYKYPSKIAPEDGETFYVETLRDEAQGEQFDVAIWGMYHNNSYFDVNTTKEKNKVVVSEAVASKFEVGIGDKLTLSDTVEGVDYAFEVVDVAPYSANLSIYMDMSAMQELFGENRDYYNVVLSKEALDIDAGRLNSINTKEDVIKAALVTQDSMYSLIYAMILVSAFVLFVVMYLMMKVAMDRASFQISLMKIFGFRSKEVRKLYLDGNFFVVILTLILGIPLAKKVVNLQFPYLMSSMTCAMNTQVSIYVYLAVVAFVLVTYILINWLLVRKIQKVTPAEVLKNRE